MRELSIGLLVLFLMMFGLFCIGNKLNERSCGLKAEIQGLNFKYSALMGGIVKYNDKWIDYDRLRYTEE